MQFTCRCSAPGNALIHAVTIESVKNACAGGAAAPPGQPPPARRRAPTARRPYPPPNAPHRPAASHHCTNCGCVAVAGCGCGWRGCGWPWLWPVVAAAGWLGLWLARGCGNSEATAG